jgi:hypothetical protein
MKKIGTAETPTMSDELRRLYKSLQEEDKKEDKKKTFRIACDWEVYGTMEIEAESLEEAIEIAIEDAPLPTDSEYLDGSFKVNHDMTNFFYEEDHSKKSSQ